jgi:tRNA(adenine34) deaminase
MEHSESDASFFRRAIELAAEAEKLGNLPIGAVITLEGRIIAEGQNAIWSPVLSLSRHAEMEALSSLPQQLRPLTREMTLYTTLEPCLMCMGSILLHHIVCVYYGSSDTYGGASQVAGHMPDYFEEEMAKTSWIGPAYAQRCNPLFERIMAAKKLRNSP